MVKKPIVGKFYLSNYAINTGIDKPYNIVKILENNSRRMVCHSICTELPQYEWHLGNDNLKEISLTDEDFLNCLKRPILSYKKEFTEFLRTKLIEEVGMTPEAFRELSKVSSNSSKEELTEEKQQQNQSITDLLQTYKPQVRYLDK